ELAVPGDLSVIGCSNCAIAEFLLPAITTIEQYPADIGRVACRHILNALNAAANARIAVPAMTPITPSLVIRESCAPPRWGYPPSGGFPPAPAR
ncbi:MAG TPA: substrate-binding domain-containing protein, partial [Armatimonadota bacterium]|nr:substrate-binding domain-containing protein [Armatimonadota bacterium]